MTNFKKSKKDYKVVFSTGHSATRALERLGVRVPRGEVPLAPTFKFVASRWCTEKKILNDWWIYPNQNNKCVLIVTSCSKVVKTVMNEGPVVDAIYNVAKVEKII